MARFKMARFKPVHKGLKLLPVEFDQQIQPGTFEYVPMPPGRLRA